MNLFELAAKITLDSSEYEKNMAKASATADNAKSKFGSLSAPLSKVQSAVSGAATVFEKIGAGVEKAARPFVTFNDKAEGLVKGTLDKIKAKNESAAAAFEKLGEKSALAKYALESLRDKGASISATFEKVKSKAETVLRPFSTLRNHLRETATQMETNRNKSAALAAAYDQAKAKVAALTAEFNRSAKENGATSEETQRLAAELDKAEKEADEAKSQMDAFADSVNKTGEKEDEASEKTSKFGTALKKGLAVGGKIAAAAIGAAATAIAAITKQSIEQYAEYEQLAGGAEKIFGKDVAGKIAADAAKAYVDLGMSANQYIGVMNDVGATFASTMGETKGYETAKRGLTAISDFASGTGKNVDELADKFTLITRSTTQYQSIADQFAGVLPQTSKDFLAQAQSAGLLSKKYSELTEVPVAEYQQAVSQMLEKGVADLNLTGNTAEEARKTISGSLSMLKASWSNLLTGMADDSQDFGSLVNNVVDSVVAVGQNIVPKIGTVLGGIAQLIEGVVPQISEQLPGLVEQLLPPLLAGVTSLLTGVTEALPALTSVLASAAPSLLENLLPTLPLIIESAAQLILGLAQGIAESLPTLTPTIVDVVLKIVEVLTDPGNLAALVNAAVAIIIGLANGLIAALPRLIEKAPVIITNLVNALVQNVPLLLKASLQAIITLAKGIIDNLPQLVTASVGSLWGLVQPIFAQFTESASSFFSETIPMIIDKVGEFFAQLPEKIAYWLGFAIGKLISWGQQAIQWAATAIPQLISNIGTFFSQLPSKIWQHLQNAWQRLKDFAANMLSTVQTEIPKICTQLVGFFKDLPANIREIGTNIVKGLWEGIKNRWNQLKDDVNGLFGSLVAGIKAGLGIASPSKVFAKIGGYMAEGLGEGWEKGYADVEKKLTKEISVRTTAKVDTAENGTPGRFGRGGISVVQHIYSKAQTAADLMREAEWQARMEVLMNV